MIKKYRKKPIVVEAVKYTGNNWGEIHEWMWQHGSEKRFKKMKTDKDGRPAEIVIETLEGDMYARVGDYIVKGVRSEFYPVKQDVFELIYEEVKSDQCTKPSEIEQEEGDRRPGYKKAKKKTIKGILKKHDITRKEMNDEISDDSFFSINMDRKFFDLGCISQEN